MSYPFEIENPQTSGSRHELGYDIIDTIEPGMHIVLTYPRRIARVDKIDMEMRNFGEGETATRRPVKIITATVTIPTRPIEEWVSEQEAASNDESVENGYRKGKIQQWEEKWRSRICHRAFIAERVAAIVDDNPADYVSQVYCESRTDHIPTDQSPNGEDPFNIVVSPIFGWAIDPGLVPYDTFLTPKQRERRHLDAVANEKRLQENAAIAKEEADWKRQAHLAEVTGDKMAAALTGLAAVPADVLEERDAEIAALKARLAKTRKPRKRAPRKKSAPKKPEAEVAV